MSDRPDSVAVVRTAPERDARAGLSAALESIGWWSRLRSRERAPGEMRVTIAVDMSFQRPGGTTAVAVALAEHLVACFHAHGYTDVAVGACVPEEGLWYENRSPRALADLAGYRYETPSGEPYDIISFQEDLIPATFPEASVLHDGSISRSWAEADVRVSFAKNKTHELLFYALNLYNLIGLLPLADRRYHYFQRLPASDVAADLYVAYPPDLALIDADISNHGTAGAHSENPHHSGTIIAATTGVLCDWVGALKMGLDPFVSPLNAAVLKREGIPRGYTLHGSLDPYPEWINVAPSMAQAAAQLRRTPEIGASLEPVLTVVDSEVFPHRNLYAGRLNALIAPYVESANDNPVSLMLVVTALAAVGALSQALEAWTTLVRKDRLQRIDAGLHIDPFARDLNEFEEIDEYIAGLEALATATPVKEQGIRLTTIDRANLFLGDRMIDESFDRFVARVDVARSIEMMNDYIGGRTVVVRRDEFGRATHQAERNIYLPQPNFIVLYGGQPIDVTKLEYITREPQRHRIVWRTIASDNDSADFDDGSVTFEPDGERTRVRLMAFQRFKLPPLLQLTRLDLWPELLGALTLDAYRVYLEGTIANFEAVFDGDEFRIGHATDAEAGETGIGLSDERLARLGSEIVTLGERLASRFPSIARSQTRGVLDADGFRHFEASARSEPATSGASSAGSQAYSAAIEFWTGLARALGRDLAE